MNLIGGVFILLSAILLIVGMIFGFIICNSINRRNERTQPTEPGTDDQLNRIEQGVKRAAQSSTYISWISLSVAAVAVGGAGLEIPLWGRLLLVGLGIIVILGTSLKTMAERRRGNI